MSQERTASTERSRLVESARGAWVSRLIDTSRRNSCGWLVFAPYMDDETQTDPNLPEALEALRRGGYSIGQSSVSAQGHTMVTVAGQMMAQEDILKLAGMCDKMTRQS